MRRALFTLALVLTGCGMESTRTDAAVDLLGVPLFDMVPMADLAQSPDLFTAPACDDKQQNGDETDIDCGGPKCPQCRLNQKCKVPRDCSTQMTCNSNLCVATTCLNGVRDGTESDVDCGGPSCPRCADAKQCQRPPDCKSGNCTGGACVPASCTDGFLDQDESDVDCGGTICPKCANGQKCGRNSDCHSNRCDYLTNACR